MEKNVRKTFVILMLSYAISKLWIKAANYETKWSIFCFIWTSILSLASYSSKAHSTLVICWTLTVWMWFPILTLFIKQSFSIWRPTRNMPVTHFGPQAATKTHYQVLAVMPAILATLNCVYWFSVYYCPLVVAWSVGEVEGMGKRGWQGGKNDH